MPDITIVKFKVRRGTNSEREKVVLDQGELGYTLDTKRLFVGEGLSGGNVVGSKNFGAFNLESGLGGTVGAQIGDFGYANSKLYTLTAESYTSDLGGWGYIGNLPDNASLEFDSSNFLSIKLSAIDATNLQNETFGVGLKRNNTAIDLRYSTRYFEISAEELTLKDGAINVASISTSLLSSGLSGGGGLPVVVNPGRGLEYITDDDGTVRIATSNATTQSVLFSALDLNMFGQGLRVNQDLKLVTATLSSVTDSFNVQNATIDLLTRSLSGNYEMPYLSIDDKGITVDVDSTFYDTMTATTLTGGDFVPVGAILPHAAAIGNVPQGYLLCDGAVLSRSAYQDLFDVIGTNYNLGGEGGSNFRIPSLTGGELLYGNNQNPNIGSPGSQVYYLSGDIVSTNYPWLNLSAVDMTFIIKATSNINGIFTGAPNQVTEGFKHSGTTYSGIDSDGITQTLSSAGFLTLSLSGQTRKNDATFDKFAIPIFNY